MAFLLAYISTTFPRTGTILISNLRKHGDLATTLKLAIGGTYAVMPERHPKVFVARRKRDSDAVGGSEVFACCKALLEIECRIIKCVGRTLRVNSERDVEPLLFDLPYREDPSSVT